MEDFLEKFLESGKIFEIWKNFWKLVLKLELFLEIGFEIGKLF